MDYREHFAHLLEHMARKVDAPCERNCPVHHHQDGGTENSYRPPDGYAGPNVESLFVALKEVGYAAAIPSSDPYHYKYFPTTLGIAFMDRYKHPRWIWFKENWFAVVVAIATLAVSGSNLVW